MKTYNNYCGNENLTFIFYNEWADPEIEYNGFRFSEPEIAGILYHMMLEENIPDTGSNLAVYINNNIEYLLSDIIYNTENMDIEYIYKNAPLHFELLRDALEDQLLENYGEFHIPTDTEVLEHYGGISFVPEDFVPCSCFAY